LDLNHQYNAETPHIWYMRDEPLSALGKNLAQEPWDFNFFHYCLKRSGNHGHIEDYGKLVGCIAVAASKPTKYEFATFRDHSWDMRVWAAIDHIFILLMALRTPLKIDGVEYTYLNVTLVSLKGNPIGLQKFTTGYLAGPKGNLQLEAATSLDDIPFDSTANGVRSPPAADTANGGKDTVVMMKMESTSEKGKARADSLGGETMLRVEMRSLIMAGRKGGDGSGVRRLQYWPDDYSFEVFEDATHSTVATHGGNTDAEGFQSVEGYGTMQTGFRRPGKFDPAMGGCG
jgi:hypothetical protein